MSNIQTPPSLKNSIAKRLRNAARSAVHGTAEAAAGIAAGEASGGNVLAIFAAEQGASYAVNRLLPFEQAWRAPLENLTTTNMPRRTFKRKTTRRRAVVRRVPRPMRVETKHFDINVNAVAFPTTPVFNTLSIGPFPILGLDFDNRIGRSIYVERMQLRVSVEIRSAAAINANGDFILMDLVLDNENKGSVGAGPQDIYDLIAAPNQLISMPNASNLRRFKTIFRKKLDINITAIAGGVVTAATVDEFSTAIIPCKKMVHFGGNFPNATAIIDNCYNICFGYDNTPVGAVAPYQISYNVRFWYKDL